MLLLIPGPVTTRPEVRAAMARDVAPWDLDTRETLAGIRARLLALSGGDASSHTVLPLQGCGHFAVEAALRSFVPPGGRILVPATGHYADRMVRLAREAGRDPVAMPCSPVEPVRAAAVAAALAADATLSHVAMVYSETSSGLVHDPAAIGAVVASAGRRLIVDAVSAFGALPLDVAALPALDAAVFTTNKCFEGMPGLSFTIARLDALLSARGQAGSWSFDLADIHAQSLRAGPGTFRFTPPIQVLTSFAVALELHAAEGGAPARLARYRANARTLHAGMMAIGLEPCLPLAVQGPIVLNVHAPDDPAWSLQSFVDRLKQQGFLISNFANTEGPSFRVGCIGAVEPADFERFTASVDAILTGMGVRTRAAARRAA